MAEAMVRGLLASGSLKKRDVTLSDIDPERLSCLVLAVRRLFLPVPRGTESRPPPITAKR